MRRTSASKSWSSRASVVNGSHGVRAMIPPVWLMPSRDVPSRTAGTLLPRVLTPTQLVKRAGRRGRRAVRCTVMPRQRRAVPRREVVPAPVASALRGSKVGAEPGATRRRVRTSSPTTVDDAAPRPCRSHACRPDPPGPSPPWRCSPSRSGCSPAPAPRRTPHPCPSRRASTRTTPAPSSRRPRCRRPRPTPPRVPTPSTSPSRRPTRVARARPAASRRSACSSPGARARSRPRGPSGWSTPVVARGRRTWSCRAASPRGSTARWSRSSTARATTARTAPAPRTSPGAPSSTSPRSPTVPPRGSPRSVSRRRR